jgi:choline dehydrogenase-like flavoprotein
MPKVDACIVGGGAGGATAAMRLAEAGWSVVLIEAGPHWNPARDFINDLEVMNKKFEWDMPVVYNGNPAEAFINTRGHTAWGVGGGTNHWTCAALRLHPNDFRSKSTDGVGADWPITYEEMEPYYEMAERQLGTASPYPEVNFPQLAHGPMPAHQLSYASQALQKGCEKLGIRSFPGSSAVNSRPHDGRPPCNYCGFCQSGCMIRANGNALVTHIPRAEKAGALIRANCYAREILLDGTGRANSVVYFDAQGREQEQEAGVVIVACYAVETPRLLLNSKSSLFPEGLANRSGLVGKNLLSHVTLRVIGVCEEPLDAFRGYPVENLLTLDFYNTDPKRGFARGYKVSSEYTTPGDFASLDPSLWGADLKKHAEQYRRHVGLVAIGEILPNDENYVTIDPVVKDKFRVPAARITHRATDRDKEVARQESETCKNILEAAGAKKLFYSHPRSGHLMGTCRMGDNPKSSVVNRYSQSHDVKNLFLMDSSVFVTGGSVNPTLTIVALANHACEHLIKNGREL